jgi:hypothetical protein
MSLTDPQSITIATVPISLPRTFVQGGKSTYESSDGLVKETFSTTPGNRGRKRHLFRLDHSKLTPNPFDTSNNVEVSMSCYMVIDVPPDGYSATEKKQPVDGFLTQLQASSGALITRVLGGES